MLNVLQDTSRANLRKGSARASAGARARLALQQADLLRALTGKEVPVAGMDEATLALVAASLRVKRRRVVARAWPRLAGALGSEFPHWFDAYAAEHLLPPAAQPLRDGQRFAHWLHARKACPDAGLVELMEVELRWYVRLGRLRIRRGPAATLRYLPSAAVWILAVRVPYLGERCWSWRLSTTRR